LDQLSIIAPSSAYPPADYTGSNWVKDRIEYGQAKFAEAQKLRGEVAALNGELQGIIAQYVEYRSYWNDLLGQLGQQLGYPGYPQPGTGYPTPGLPQPGTGYPAPGYPQPGTSQPGLPQSGAAQAPTTPPPAYIPQKPSQAPGYYAIDPGAFFGCMFRFTYVWLTSGDQFWFFPIYTGPNSGAGFRWNGATWRYYAIDLRLIDAVTC
jgi:hypothetical protein